MDSTSDLDFLTEEDTKNIISAAKMGTLSLGKGDVLVVFLSAELLKGLDDKGMVTLETRLRKICHDVFPNNKMMMMPESISFGVIQQK